MINFTSPTLIERSLFEQFLLEVNPLMLKKNIPPPSGFISYAWESDNQNNIALQTWLLQLKKDFESLGILLFLDIQEMNGNMRQCMQQISEKYFVFLIGTPRFKQSAEQDLLYLLNNFTPHRLPKQSNGILFIQSENKFYLIENGTLLPNLNTFYNIDITQIEWLSEPGYKPVKLSHNVTSIIEEITSKLTTKPITNVAFEIGLACDKEK